MDNLTQRPAQVEDLSSPGQLVVRLRRAIRASPQRVWETITTPESMRQWLGPCTFEPQLGGRILFDVQHGTRPDGTPQRWLMFGNITVWRDLAELAFTWQEFDVAELRAWPVPTTVSLCLEAVAGGTTVTLSHSGFEQLPDALAQFEGYSSGWSSLNDLAELARMCETETS